MRVAAPVKFTAAAMLLHEGVQGGKQLWHSAGEGNTGLGLGRSLPFGDLEAPVG
jgi:hypothetical protein